MQVIITIPAYNEADTLKTVIGDIHRVMRGTYPGAYTVMVQDDGSTDHTFSVAKEHADHAHSNGAHRGLAETFRQEIRHCLEAGADIIVHTDADGQYPAQYIPALIEKVREGCDLAVGSRFLGGMRYGNSRCRGVENLGFSKAVSLLCKHPITDITSGMRAMNRKAASIPIRSNYTYTYEQYIQAVYRGLNIAEIPIIGTKTRKSKLAKTAFHYGAHAAHDFIRYYRLWKRSM